MLNFVIQKCLSGVKRLASSVDQRLPITLDLLQVMCNNCQLVTDSPYHKLLLRAMLSVGFYAFLRPGEMTRSVNNIQLDQVALSKSNMSIKFISFKHHHGNPVTVTIPAQGGPTCPLLCLAAYLQTRGLSDGPLFVNPDSYPVTYNQFKTWFAQLLQACNIRGHYGPHSLRIGAATIFIAKGCSSALVQQMGRWKSNAYLRYIRLPSIRLH